MIDFFARMLAARNLPPLPDDDLSIEGRWPRFKFVANPAVRKLQRKCLIHAEHQRDHPELYPHLAREQARLKALADGPKPRVGSESVAAPDSWDDARWAGIEDTAPAHVRRHFNKGD